MNITQCSKCDELSQALNHNLWRAHQGDTGASIAVTKVAAALRLHRTRCPLNPDSRMVVEKRDAQSRAA